MSKIYPMIIMLGTLPLRYFIFTLTAFSLCVSFAHGQVNTERMRRFDSTRGAFYGFSVKAGMERGATEYVSVAGTTRLDIVADAAYHFGVARYDFKESGDGKIANKGFLHLRTMWDVTSILSLEGFVQAQYNEFLSLSNRNLLGAGGRWSFPAIRDEQGHDVLRLFIGTGAMFEHELYHPAQGSIQLDRVRLTNYLSLYIRSGERLNFTAIAYYQPLPTAFGDYRFIAESSLALAITKRIAWLVDCTYRYDSMPVARQSNYDFELANGISITLP